MKKKMGDDHTNSLPDECLALIFNFLTTSKDRNNSSLVSRRWLQIDAQTRTHLTLNAELDLQPFIPSIFTRFNSLTQLVLRNNVKYHCSIEDDDIILITSMFPNLTRLKLCGCDQLTDSGMAAFSKNCTKLKEFSCAFCSFSELGLFELLDNRSQLEVLSVERLGFPEREVLSSPPKLHATKALKVIKLKQVYRERLFIPLISVSKNLKTLKLLDCHDGYWDKALEMIQDDNCLTEVHLDYVYVTDVGVSSLSKCRHLNDLRIVGTDCTNVGLIRVAQNCKGLKKLYVGSGIGDEGLIAVGRHNVNLEELILFSVDATCDSLRVIATNCQKLVRLELCMNHTITDNDIMCIADNCVALKILSLAGCDVSNKGIEAFALGSPNLAEITVTNCKKVTREAIDRLRASRESLVIKMGSSKTSAINIDN
ncbi:VIER F-box protein 2 [Artemisia annua]|uniref:VIER F-box protein 2 n=1 Tax=Artemisia annua TaxID=35608 RepID=A0A2U1MY03_ARTAN|nr:VIER F-box protein 2 [Artemisia annua]